MGLLQILRTGRIDEGANRCEQVARADVLPAERGAARAIEDAADVVILVHHHHRHEPLARLRQGDGDRPRVEIEDCQRVERIAVGAHAGVFDRQLSMMENSPRAPSLTKLAKYMSVSARAKLSTVTATGPDGVCASAPPAKSEIPASVAANLMAVLLSRPSRWPAVPRVFSTNLVPGGSNRSGEGLHPVEGEEPRSGSGASRGLGVMAASGHGLVPVWRTATAPANSTAHVPDIAFCHPISSRASGSALVSPRRCR